MFELNEFCTVSSLEQADELLHRDKKNVILGGLLWMRMGSRQYHTGIDLSGLSLDKIEDTGHHIEIGAMTRLRQIETSDLLSDNFGAVLRDAVAPIVGVQFRNLATIGGSVFSRFSFSDITTALMVLNTQVHLHRGGVIPIEEFVENSPGRDILVKLSIPKQKIRTAYRSVRKTATDFPVLAAALSRSKDGWKIALGARPSRARLAQEAAKYLSHDPDDKQIEFACTKVVEEMAFGNNQRGSRTYREQLAKTLVKRGIEAICS